jgi:anti-sigma regulatory factor (Ser/Thr protein kinase)
VRLVLPRLLLLDTILKDLNWVWDCQDPEIEVSAVAPIEHMEPPALVAFAAWAAHQRVNGRRIRVLDSVRSPYTWRYGLLSALTGLPGSSEMATRFLPPTQILSEATIAEVLNRAVHALGLSALGVRTSITWAMSEALRNVFEHANSPTGAFLSASFFPARDRVSFAVADTGVGVPRTIRRQYGASLTDAQANETAVQLKTSGAPRSPKYGGSVKNAGVGLFYLRSMSARSAGLFALLSESAFVRGTVDNSLPEIAETQARWNGTVVTVSLSAARAEDALHAVRVLLTRGLSAQPKKQLVGFGDPPSGSEIVRFAPTAAGVIENKEEANRAREEVLLPAIAAGRRVGIDLRLGQAATHSFVHALLYAPIKDIAAKIICR